MKYSVSSRIKNYFLKFLDSIIGIVNIKLFIRVLAAYRIYRRVGAAKYRSGDADTVIWVYYPNFRVYKYTLPWDVLLMAYAAANKQKFMVHKGADIGKYRDKKILFSIHKDKINFFQVENYSSFYQLVTEQLEDQNNKVYPTHHDILYWENKIYMHEMFDKLGIRSPKTTIYSNFEEVIDKETTFPFLIKIPHSSGSYGLFNVTDKDYLLSLRTDKIILANKHYIIQERLNITCDMRAILVNGEIVLSYWRINKDKSKWKTTSTGHGSTVDFEFFPEQWRQNIIDSFKKLNIITGACDIGFQNDDINTPPYFFEVSPSYDINPKLTDEAILNNYGGWKKQLLLKNSFDRMFVEATYEIKGKAVAEFFKRCAEKN